MDLVNTYEHRISVTAGDDHVVVRPGPFSADGKAADLFLKLPGVVRADSDEADAWKGAHPDEFPSDGAGSNIDRRNRAAAFADGARSDIAKRNREVIGDDAAPGGPASGVVSAGGDRPLSPALQTTETEADALRGGIDLSDEPDLGPVGQTAATVGDAAPGSPPDGMPHAPVLSAPIPQRSGVGETPGDEFDSLKGDELDNAVTEAGVDASTGGSNRDGSLNADEKRQALRDHAAAQAPPA